MEFIVLDATVVQLVGLRLEFVSEYFHYGLILLVEGLVKLEDTLEMVGNHGMVQEHELAFLQYFGAVRDRQI